MIMSMYMTVRIVVVMDSDGKITSKTMCVDAYAHGSRVARFECPVGDDRDQRSDVADLCARAWDAIMGMERAQQPTFTAEAAKPTLSASRTKFANSVET